MELFSHSSSVRQGVDDTIVTPRVLELLESFSLTWLKVFLGAFTWIFITRHYQQITTRLPAFAWGGSRACIRSELFLFFFAILCEINNAPFSLLCVCIQEGEYHNN